MTPAKGTHSKSGLRARLTHWISRVVKRPSRHSSQGKGSIPAAWIRKLPPEEINALETASYKGPITLVASHKAVLEAVAELKREKLLGFDTETRPSFVSGVAYPPALLQLVGAHTAFLFRLKATGLPPELTALLADPAIIKAGVSVSKDVKELRTMAEFEPHGFVDLGTASEKMGLQHHGLRGLAAVVLGVRISKSARTTNWDNRTLPDFAVRYAATDGWLGRKLYEEFKRHTELPPLDLAGPQPESNRMRRRREFRGRRHHDRNEQGHAKPPTSRD